jgi:glycosyltransferase involved in cell wall biosynthesis
MSAPPSVSIIVPVYNVEHYLAVSLTSVLGQTLKDIEVIAIDDGSTDGSPDILRRFELADKRVVAKRQENAGAGAARNHGLSLASGRYVYFLDSDDVLYNEQALSRLFSAMSKSGMNMCGGNFELICDRAKNSSKPDDVNILDKELFYKNSTNFHFATEKVGQASDYKSASWFWRFIFDREFLLRHDIHFPDYRRFQDVPFLAKAITKTNGIHFIADITHCYRVNHKIMKYTKAQKTDIVNALADVLATYEEGSALVQYSDALTILVEMTDVFSNDILTGRESDNALKSRINEVFASIDYDKISGKFLSKTDISRLKPLLAPPSYEKLLSVETGSVFFDVPDPQRRTVDTKPIMSAHPH